MRNFYHFYSLAGQKYETIGAFFYGILLLVTLDALMNFRFFIFIFDHGISILSFLLLYEQSAF